MGEHFLLKLKHQGHIKLLIILSLMTAAVFTLSIQIISNRSIDKLSDTNDLLVNRFKSITLLEETNGNLRTIESDARGYLITGDPDFKEEMQKAKENLAEIALILEANANLGETNGNTMAELAVLIAEKISWNDQLIQLIDNGSSAEAEIMLKAGSSKLLMNDIGNLITELRLQEEIYVADKTSSAQNLGWRSTTGTLLGTVLSFIVTLMAAWLIFSELRRQNILHQQLEENEKRLIQFLESMPVGVAVVSKKHELHFLNSEGRKILGIKDLNYQNTILKFEDIVATATNAKVNLDTKIKDVFLGKSLTNTSIKYTTQSGERQLHSTWRPMISEVGEIEYAIVTFYDVTARKKAKTELIKARKLAEDSVKAKESFLANMSHEIRTPMNAIVGFTEILMQEGVSASQKRKLDLIKVSGDNLLTIINDILDFSKIEAGMMHLEKIAISLPETIQSVYNTMLMKADDKGINFSLKNVEDLPKAVLGDSVRLSQILINLLNNAIKFTNEGTVELNCASQPLSDSKTLVTLTIKDSGLGMSAEQIRRIFDRFSQAHADTTRKYGGTGLGLNIVKKLVDLHNGSLEVVSTPGKGSEFIINLPFVLTDD
ncbi:MAG: ATP-binding protein, partial [Cyclobacteriaceae bacterium]